MFEKPQKAQVARIKIEAISLDSTSIAPFLDGPLLAYSVEKLVWLRGAGTAAKFDLIERPQLNATNAGDGL